MALEHSILLENERYAYREWCVTTNTLIHVNQLRQHGDYRGPAGDRLHDAAVKGEQDAFERWKLACEELDAADFDDDYGCC